MLRCQVPNRVTAGHRSRTTTVAVRALSLQEAGTQIAQAFVRVLSPPDGTVKAWPQNPFKGNIRRSHRPFRDGFSRNYTPPIEKALESIDEGPASYVEDAVKGVVAGLPSSNLSEPVWTGAITGWRGELHAADKRNPRDGFHAKKY